MNLSDLVPDLRPKTKGLRNTVLPLEARLVLQMAAETPIPADDPLARVKAIDAATARVKRLYPHHFKKEI